MLLQLIDVVEVGQVGMLDVGIFSGATPRLRQHPEIEVCKG